MAQRTLLSIVQEILSVMDSDEVNSILDTIESTQVANVVKEVHDELVVEYDIPREKTLTQLTGLADVGTPTFMNMPASISSIDFIKYDTRSEVADDPNLELISFLDPSSFLRTVQGRNKSDSNIVTSSIGNVELYLYSDRAPTYWTSFDDNLLVFDAYNSTLEVTMQTSNSVLFGDEDPDLVVLDGTLINLPPKLMPLLLNEAKATSFAYFKDQPNYKVETRARRARNSAQRNKQLTGYVSQINYSSYGRV